MSKLRQIALTNLEAPSVDVRTVMDENKFDELVESIRHNGVIEPVVVRPLGEDKYEIVAGARRVMAARAAGMGKIQCIISSFSDEDVDIIRLEENLIREDVCQVDIARYVEKLMQKYGLTQEQAAKRIGRTPGFVSQMMSLLRKDPVVRDMVEQQEISYAVGRELLRIPTEKERRRYASFAKQSGANVQTVRNWANRVLLDTDRAAGEFHEPEAEPEETPIQPSIVTHPCRDCGRVAP